MKTRKIYQIVLFVMFCILLNFQGRLLTEHYNLPLWMDSLGTCFGAYALGPICGSMIGVTGNLIYGMSNQVSSVYAVYSAASVVIGVIVGLSAKKGRFSTLFDTMTVSSFIALSCTLISVPLNIMIYNGMTGNIWGNGVIGYLREAGWPSILCYFIGELYIEFLDKFLTLMILYIFVNGMNYGRKTAEDQKEIRQNRKAAAKAGRMLVFFILFLWGITGAFSVEVKADKSEAIDYNDYVQTIYSSTNGLPCGEANDIVQTNDGILWIGTYAGLYRYNGSAFRWMDEYESVRNVNCLYVDEEGRLWIGTNDNGVSICINEKIVNIVDEDSGLPSNSVRCIGQGSEGYYYIGTTGNMQILTLNSGLKRVERLREINYADSITSDAKGNVVTVTSNGEVFLIQGTQILSSMNFLNERELFNSCGFDQEGHLLLGTSENHLLKYDISEGSFTLLDSMDCEGLSHINDLYFLEDGSIFVCADNGVGYLKEWGFYQGINTNNFNNSIDNMVMDYQGNFWFTSSRLGLLRLAQSAFKDVYSTIGMENQVVNTVSRWGDDFYIGTDKGLDVVDASCRNQYFNELTELLDGVRIRCIRTDSKGRLWICTYGRGLLEVDTDFSQYIYNSENGSFGNRARVVKELRDGTILAAGDTGLSFIADHQILKTIRYGDGEINAMVLTITEMADGRIMAGTDGDGIVVFKDGEMIDKITRQSGLSSGVILRTVYDAKADGVFVVTSNGLCYVDSEGSVRSLDNFPYFNNYDIWTADNSTLFVMSSAGIYVVSRDDLLSGKKDLSYELLDSKQGLNSALTANSWNYSDENGLLFLPCDSGVYIIDTEQYSQGIRTYRMNLSSVLLDNVSHRVDRSETLLIGRGISKMELFPEIINYTIENPYVGYYLDGFDSDWTILPQNSLNSIVYTNLPSGEYIFHLAVFDNNKETILEELTCRIRKDKEIYDNQYFMIYMVLVAMLAVSWFTIYVVRTQVQRTMMIQRKELELTRKQLQMGNETILAIAKAVDAKDVNTSQHSRRVSEYSVMIAREMGFTEKECENLRRAAQMHDIGKIGIPDRILNKPGRLTDEEYAVMKSHVLRGGEILKEFTLIDNVVQGALYHHERYDGKGYPEGLKGDEIPLYGRIIGVADAFDAMTANRVYRKQMDLDYVLGEMHRGRGTQFDPAIVDIMLHLIEEGKINLKELYPGWDEAQVEHNHEPDLASEKAKSQEKPAGQADDADRTSRETGGGLTA